jgi:anaerobic magnesium-protoporphyrin IX monomethyl ester cyclase
MRPMRVLLIKSSSRFAKNPGMSPPTGLLYLAAYVRRHLGARVHVLETFFEADPVRSVTRAVRELAPDVVGVSALTADASLTRQLTSAVKQQRADLPVVLGGPHASCDLDEATTDEHVDVAVVGEGEETFAELLQVIQAEGPAWRRPETLEAVRGLAFRQEGELRTTSPRPLIQDLDSLPFPAWDLIDYRRYWSLQSMASGGIRPYLTMFTSRGCPYGCVYCHQLFGKRFRARSPESVADEVASLLGRGAQDIEVMDDIANFDGARFDGILELLLERALHPVLSFPNGVRADIMEEHSVDLLARVGVGEVSIAFETASPRLQKLIRKHLSVDRALATVEAMARRRVFTRGYFMLGFPTETRAEMWETIQLAHASRLHLALFFTPNPFPGTELYDMSHSHRQDLGGDDTMDFEYFGGPFNASDIPDPVYQALYRWAFLGFYGDPRRMARILRDRPSLKDLPTRAAQILRITAPAR